MGQFAGHDISRIQSGACGALIYCCVPMTLVMCAAAVCAQTPSLQSESDDVSIQSTSPSGLSEDNPFAASSSLPLHAPAFDNIRTEHYQPAFMAGMKQQLSEIEAITEQADPPTFENTVEAMERSGALLSRVEQVFFNMTGSHTNKDLQNIQK